NCPDPFSTRAPAPSKPTICSVICQELRQEHPASYSWRATPRCSGYFQYEKLNVPASPISLENTVRNNDLGPLLTVAGQREVANQACRDGTVLSGLFDCS